MTLEESRIHSVYAENDDLFTVRFRAMAGADQENEQNRYDAAR
jgi:hypothetical protein